MDTIVNAQIITGKEIEKIANTYKRDSPDKKTITYLNEKLAKLTELWIEFEERDIQLRSKFSEYRHHNYFATDFYQKVEEIYVKLKMEIEKLIEDVKKHAESTSQSTESERKANQQKINDGNTEKTNNNIESQMKLVKNQKRLIKTFEKIVENLKLVKEIQSNEYYDLKNEMIQKHWAEINEYNDIIYDTINDPTNFEYTLDEFIKIQQNYEEVCIKFARERNQIMHNTENLNTVQFHSEPIMTTSMMKLPKIELPKFDGNYLRWQQFHDLFKQMVHCQPLANAQKMF